MSPERRAVLALYEDAACKELHALVKSLRRDRGCGGVDDVIELVSVKGNGNFVNEVPKMLRLPVKQTKRPPDLVVCVADADRPQALAPNAPVVPVGGDLAALDRWVLEVEAAWHQHLKSKAHLSDDAAARLRVICLRWSKESLLLASPLALVEYANADGRQQGGKVTALLDACKPCPTSLADGDFLVSYRKPGRCLDAVFQEIVGHGYQKKRDDEDLLRDHINPQPLRRGEVLKRCPDLERLLQAIG